MRAARRKGATMPKTQFAAKPFLGWHDVARIFDCGRSKALLIMHEVGVVYIGHAAFVRASDLDDYLAQHGSIDIAWPASASRRKGARHGRR